MDYNKIEDAVFKKAMETFEQSAVDFFNINTKIIAPAATEIKNIDITINYTDYLFYTSDGNYLHFEFQTTNKKDDIKRFLYYDASLFYKEKRKVRTIVIYSSDIEDTERYIDAGTIKYTMEPFYMKNIDGDSKLEYLQSKVREGVELSQTDILTLTLLPLMKGSESRSMRAVKSIELAEKMQDNENKTQCISLLYALLEKFGDPISKKKLKEVFSMTEIGKMIIGEALEKGRKQGEQKGKMEGKIEGKIEGKREGKIETIIKILSKKFGNRVTEEYKSKLRELSDDIIDVITVEIIDIKDIKEIEKYF